MTTTQTHVDVTSKIKREFEKYGYSVIQEENTLKIKIEPNFAIELTVKGIYGEYAEIMIEHGFINLREYINLKNIKKEIASLILTYRHGVFGGASYRYVKSSFRNLVENIEDKTLLDKLLRANKLP